jgi:hypothetical protein
MWLKLCLKSPEVVMWRALEFRFVAIVIDASMPVLSASSVALFAGGSLEARQRDAHESKKLVGTHVPFSARVEQQLRDMAS